MKIKQLLLRLFAAISTTVTLKSDVRDFLLFSGLFFVGYGLWLYAPWIGFTVGGGLLMVIAMIMRD